MKKQNKVFIATSIDGYISDRNGSIDWLQSVPNPDQNDMGYTAFYETIDALVMGRNTYETVLGFDLDWPYDKAVFVLSNSIKKVPESLKNKVFLVNGDLPAVLDQIHQKGFHKLYIDGGKTIQNFLKEDLIDEMILTTIPIVLGGGSSLFNTLNQELRFDLLETKTYLNAVVQTHYKRKR